MSDKLTVLVLGGGPDREREVSLVSASQVAAALRQAGHTTLERDILPGDASALDERYDVVFPVLHGAFGEGGPLQELLEQRGVAFVGCGSKAARTAMDKVATKQVAREIGVPTPDWQVLRSADAFTLGLPVVIKPLTEGSSVGVFLCQSETDVAAARQQLGGHAQLLAERLIKGREMTVGVVEGRALPVLEIIPAPAVTFYDYQAKYSRDDTRYSFDVPAELAGPMQQYAEQLFKAMDCRHLSRVDFMVDGQNRSWLLEINTMPGFTGHSLLPMAAKRTGLDMPALCDRLVKLAMKQAAGR